MEHIIFIIHYIKVPRNKRTSSIQVSATYNFILLLLRILTYQYSLLRKFQMTNNTFLFLFIKKFPNKQKHSIQTKSSPSTPVMRHSLSSPSPPQKIFPAYSNCFSSTIEFTSNSTDTQSIPSCPLFSEKQLPSNFLLQINCQIYLRPDISLQARYSRPLCLTKKRILLIKVIPFVVFRFKYGKRRYSSFSNAST